MALREADEVSQSQHTYSKDIPEIFNLYDFVYCWVEDDCMHDADEFDFSFRLWCRSYNNYIPFHVKLQTLQKLLSYVCEEKIYFAAEGFPPTPKSIERNSSLQQKITFMENLMIITNRVEYQKKVGNVEETYVCKRRKLHWYSKQLMAATDDDKKAMVNVINKLLNSATLIKEENLYTVSGIDSDIFKILNIPEEIENCNPKELIQAKANELLNKLKAKKSIELPMGLTWTESDIVTGIEFEESKETIQEGFTANQCRLNNPVACWKPQMEHKEIKHSENKPRMEQEDEEEKYSTNYPELIIKLGRKGTDISKLRIQGYQCNNKLSYISGFELRYWEKDENSWLYQNVYDKYDVSALDSGGYVDVHVSPYFYTRKIQIIPTEYVNEIALRLEIFGPLTFNHRQLLTLSHVKFQQLYVATHFGNADEINLKSHWALKFEGPEYLLTIEWFANNRVLSTLEKNNCIGQKKFWYSTYDNDTEWFTQRWGTLFMLNIYYSDSEINQKEISAECIGKLIDCWIKESGKYDVIGNNCQHFVRDMLSLFSKKAANYLIHQMEHVQLNAAIHPILEVCDERSGHKRIRIIREKLVHTFRKHRDKHKYKTFDKLKWSKEQCAEWVGSLGVSYQQYTQRFVDDGIDGKFLTEEMNDKLLQDIVSSALHRRKILSAWNKLQ
eukprot:530598_1